MSTTNNNYKVLKLTHVNGPDYEIALRVPNGQIVLLPVHEELVLKFRLVVGKELDELQIDELNGKLDLGDAYQYTLKLLSRRSYTTAQIQEKLESKNYAAHVINEVLGRLINAGLLNDGEYVRSYIHQEMVMGKKGPNKIKLELMRKGVSESVIDQYLPAYGEEYQTEHALKIAHRLINSNYKYGVHVIRQKVINQLINKGFNQQIIDRVMNHLEVEDTQDNQQDILRKEVQKYYQKHRSLNDYQRKTKVVSALIRKGFNYEDVLSVYHNLMEIE